MPHDRDALRALVEKVRAAKEPDRELDAEIWWLFAEHSNTDRAILAWAGKRGVAYALGRFAGSTWRAQSWLPSYTASLDAALALVCRTFPKHGYRIQRENPDAKPVATLFAPPECAGHGRGTQTARGPTTRSPSSQPFSRPSSPRPKPMREDSMPSSPTARDAAEGLPTSDFRQGRRVPRNVYHGNEPLFMAATEELAGELVAILNAGTAALRSAGTEGGETQGAGPGRAPDGAGLLPAGHAPAGHEPAACDPSRGGRPYVE